jgi:hypothetical protein
MKGGRDALISPLKIISDSAFGAFKTRSSVAKRERPVSAAQAANSRSQLLTGISLMT